MNNATAFSFGFLVGTGLTFVICKKIFTDAGRKIGQEETTKKAEEEIASVKAAFAALAEEDKNKDPNKSKTDAMNALNEYQGVPTPEDDEPRIIKPEEFNDPNQAVVSLYYYAKNEKLLYASGGIVEHPEDLFPTEFLNHFGEYEEDMLYVRDPAEGVDYDIEYLNERYKE